MRLVIANPHAAIVGGAETYLRELLPTLRGRGHELALLHENQAAEWTGKITEHVPGLTCWHAGGQPLQALMARVADWRPDVVYAQGLESPELEHALLERFPVVLFAHNYHGTCPSGTKRFAAPSPRPCGRTFGVGCLVRFYPRRCGGLNPRTMLRQYRLQQQRMALLPRYRSVLVASRHMRQEFLRHGVSEDRLHLLPLFPPGQTPDPSPPPDRPQTGRILMVGRLTDVKGGRPLIEAVRRARTALGRPLSLVIAGDGPDRPALENAARAAGVDVEFTGWVAPYKRTELMRAADLLAVPSVWPEPFGLVGIEAGCVGLPTVAFAVGGIPDWLEAGRSGELAPGDPPTAAGLAEALVRALRDADHLNALRRGAWRKAGEFSPERHVARLEEILERAWHG
jgi:glycosyltransferase involved in cell wall biosynthesis